MPPLPLNHQEGGPPIRLVDGRERIVLGVVPRLLRGERMGSAEGVVELAGDREQAVAELLGGEPPAAEVGEPPVLRVGARRGSARTPEVSLA